ncbi:hypothetical protein Ctob_015586 [Chrysochromulina tobinii]|uniref:Uncharacterized protein n=1 Tax=Chrysochromulina tobinii TaxID=1460289 RepID=A0A0M0JZ10_9EUKA|nr:hypothetical protein Ctob_015586 [Chrysochromulina tobinii]|eukprot:KOO31795.1 hypothetical protein Ctob_015586 [Chrysochromulina sp. CCMP291]
MRRQDGGEMHPEDGRLTAEGYMALFNSIRVDEAAQYACDWDARLVDYPVVLIPRRDAYNPFHGHETLLALWSTYLARGLDPCDTGVLLSDYFDDRSGSVSSGASSRSPMFELIARVFAPVRGVERVADVGARLCATCYRRLIVAIDPIDNFEIPYYQEDGHKGSLSPCGHSPWLMGFARFSLAGFGLEHGARPERAVPHVTLLARRPYQREVWNPEPFDTMRVMANRQELGHAIALLCRSIPSPDGPSAAAETRRCTASLEVDMATLPVHEQVGIASATDVLIGTHGAPFTWMIYMPSHAYVLEMISKTSSLDGPAFCFLTYKATADGSDGCVELIELTKRQRGLVNGGIEFLGHKIKPLIDGKPDPSAKTWVLAFSEEEAVAAWDDINFGEPCIGIFADGVQVLTRYKRVVCKGLSGLPKSGKEVELLISELAPEKPLRSISFVGSDPPTVNDYNCLIVGPSKLDKEVPPTVGTIASTSNDDVYDAFLARKNGYLVREADKLLNQMVADVGKGLQPIISTGQKHCVIAYKNALMRRVFVHESMGKFIAKARADGSVELHVVRGEVDPASEFAKMGKLVFELFYRADLDSLG